MHAIIIMHGLVQGLGLKCCIQEVIISFQKSLIAHDLSFFFMWHDHVLLLFGRVKSPAYIFCVQIGSYYEQQQQQEKK